MGGIEHATPGIIVLTICLLGPVLWCIRAAVGGREFYVRRIPGVDAINESIGRAAELGKPVSFTTALTSLGPTLYACLGILYHVARKCAQYRLKLFLPQNQPDVMAVSEDVVRDAYRIEGRLSSFDPENIVYLSDEQFAFASGYMGLLHREKVGAALMFGRFAGESLILAEAGQQIGAMQVAGSVSPEQVPFFVSTCDYTLIGEELFGASAYLTREPIQLGSLVGQDIAKLFIAGLILCGVVVATYNSLWPERKVGGVEEYILAPWSSSKGASHE